MKPSDVTRERDLVALDKIIYEAKGFWISIRHDGAIALVEQRSGEKPVASITIPRRTFQKFLAWYDTEQT